MSRLGLWLELLEFMTVYEHLQEHSDISQIDYITTYLGAEVEANWEPMGEG